MASLAATLLVVVLLIALHHYIILRQTNAFFVTNDYLSRKHNDVKDSVMRIAAELSDEVRATATQLKVQSAQLGELAAAVASVKVRLAELDAKQRSHQTEASALFADALHSLNDTAAQVRSVVSRINDDDGKADGIRASVHSIARELSVVEFLIEKRLGALGGRVSRNASSLMMPAVRACDVPCNERGLSVRVPEITDDCECICVSGWAGPFCSVHPKGYDPALMESLRGTPRPLVVFNRHEPLPPLQERGAGCREAAVKYYLKRYKSEEFRTDTALNFFWFLARDSLLPSCSTTESQVIVIDVGANVGQHLQYWRREFLTHTNCERNDTLVILVEPNPMNLAVLRHRVRQNWINGVKMNVSSRMVVSGDVIVRDEALSHFVGEAKFVVNRNQLRSNLKGNERGSLNAENRKLDQEGVRTFWTRVRTLPSLLASLPVGSLRENYTISLLKIDAEGYDPAVIYGAEAVLHRVNMIVFECHKLWKSANFTLREVAEFLAKHSFSTFKIGMFYWIPMTPPAYWDDVYDETLEWSNCIAIRNSHPFSHMFSVPPPCEN